MTTSKKTSADEKADFPEPTNDGLGLDDPADNDPQTQEGQDQSEDEKDSELGLDGETSDADQPAQQEGASGAEESGGEDSGDSEGNKQTKPKSKVRSRNSKKRPGEKSGKPNLAKRATKADCPGCNKREPITQVRHYKDLNTKTAKVVLMQEQLFECQECGSRVWKRGPAT